MTFNAATLTLMGTIADSASVSVSDPFVTIGAGGATLTGAGRWTLTNNAANKIVGLESADTLTLATTLAGAGQLGGGELTLAVQSTGTVAAIGSQGLVVDTGANTIENAGLMEAIGAGGLSIDSAIQNDGKLAAINGVVTVTGAVSGAGSALIKGSGTLVFGSTFNENVAFAGAGGQLVLSDSQDYAGTVSGFSKTGATSLDLRDIGFVSSSEASWSGGVLTVTDGTHTAHIKLAGNYARSTFTTSGDGHNGVIVTDPTLLSQYMAAGLQSDAGASLAAEPLSHLVAQPHLQLAASIG
jgi:hypothetical protein